MDRDRLTALLGAERATHLERNPGSRAQFDGAIHLFTGVPMTWMANWAGRFPLALAGARGARVTDVDGHTYVDFALGDTGAMAGHSPVPVVDAIRRRVEELGGITAMLPSEDAEWVAAELTRRFGLGQWSFALSATDANRWALRLARLATGRPKVWSSPTATTAASMRRSSWRVRTAPPSHVRATWPRRRPVRDHGGRRVQRPRRGGACAPGGDIAAVLTSRRSPTSASSPPRTASTPACARSATRRGRC